MDVDIIQKKFENLNIKILSRENNPILWDRVLEKKDFLNVFESSSYLNYQNEYFKKNIRELSFIATKNEEPVFLFPLFYDEEKNFFFNYENNYLKIPDQNLDQDIKNIILNLFQGYNALFFNPKNYDLTKLKHQEICNTLNLNLEDDLNKIFSKFRKSYKSIIRKKDSALEQNIVYKKKILEEWKEFKDLHKKVSGKITRSDESWDIQRKNIMEGNGLFVFYKNNKLQLS